MKHSLLHLLILAAVSVLLLSCRQETNVADARKQIEEADARQVEAFKTKNLEAMAANYAADAVIMAPNSAIVSGKQEIHTFFKEMTAIMGEFSFAMTRFDASGDLAYEVGTYNGVFASMPDTGKYLTVWKRQPNGQWAIVVDIFNTDMAAPPPDAGMTK